MADDMPVSKKKKKIKKKAAKKKVVSKKSMKSEIVSKATHGKNLSTNERFLLGMYPILPDEDKPRTESLGAVRWGYRSHIKHPLTENEIKSIYMMAMRGIKTADIYAVLGFHSAGWLRCLEDHPRVSAMLDRGRVMGKHEIAKTFHEMATDGNNPQVTIQAMKTRVDPQDKDKTIMSIEMGKGDGLTPVGGEGTPDNPEVLEEPATQPFKITIVQSRSNEGNESV